MSRDQVHNSADSSTTQGVTADNTDVAVCILCACQNGLCLILLKETSVLTIPNLGEPGNDQSCARSRTGQPSDFSTTLNSPLKLTIGDGFKYEELQRVY